MIKRIWQAAGLCGCLILAGCETLSYYQQGLGGQMALWKARQPIARVLENPQLSPMQKDKLQDVQRIRAFAETELSMPVRHQYDTYADVGRRYVAWAVMAAPPYSLQPKQWCYPLVGCLDYHGFFAEIKAHRYAQALSQQGMDIYVAPVQAYSTLGWFHDSVLSGFLTLSEPDLAQLIFHELAHQRLFFKGDTAFNESFATAVSEEGLHRYAAAYHLDLSAWQHQQAAQAEVMHLLMKTRTKLQLFYAKGGQVSAMAEGKAKILSELKHDFAQMRAQHPGVAVYQSFVDGANNASLASVADYHDLVPTFMSLLQRDHGDMQRFFADCASLRSLHPAARRQALLVLVQSKST
ncbi:MAG: aminopeptidase [Pseudomonadales bacterium]|nr:aminopeptidase [Pseudomonadales bacterium]